jgi:hypothetical protein
MSKMLAWLYHALRYEPAVLLYGLATGLDMLFSFGFVHWTTDQRGAALTIATGVLTIVQMCLVREWSVPVITATVATGLTAAVAFGFPHLSDHTLGLITAVLVFGLGLLGLRPAVTPTVAAASVPNPAPARL